MPAPAGTISDRLQTTTPNQQHEFVGHEAVVSQLSQACHDGTLHHALLFSGAKGIGKATLAFRLARYILAKESRTPLEQTSENLLHVPPSHPTFARISQQSHGDVLILGAEYNVDEAAKTSDIKVDATKKLQHFAHMTSSETPCRFIVVDAADDLNTNAANAILKLLEEPPANTYFFLISHQPGALLPTIRSRCQYVRMQLLDDASTQQVLLQSANDADAGSLSDLSRLASGQPGLALDYYQHEGLTILKRLNTIYQAFPDITHKQVRDLAAMVAGAKQSQQWRIFTRLFQQSLHTAIIQKAVANTDTDANGIFQLNRLCQTLSSQQMLTVLSQSDELIRSCERLHLDKSAVIENIFMYMLRGMTT